jgi:hypothetical protein
MIGAFAIRLPGTPTSPAIDCVDAFATAAVAEAFCRDGRTDAADAGIASLDTCAAAPAFFFAIIERATATAAATAAAMSASLILGLGFLSALRPRGDLLFWDLVICATRRFRSAEAGDGEVVAEGRGTPAIVSGAAADEDLFAAALGFQ